MKKYFSVGLAVLCLPLTSCFDSCGVYPGNDELAKNRQISIASWNVQALFDGSDEGIEYEDYRPTNGWNAEKYEARLTAIAAALDGVCERGPDVAVLIEVENSGVIDTLGSNYFKKNGYVHRLFAGNPGYSLGVGILSRYSITKYTVHSSNKLNEVLPRPIAEIHLEPGGSPLVLFICHWKSKLGGDESTEKMRREAARLIIRRGTEIHAENPRIPILVLGDLNENYDEFYRREEKAVCALMPDDPAAARYAGFLTENAAASVGDTEDTDILENAVFKEESPQDFLVLSSLKPPCSAFFPYATGVYYTPWGSELGNGSYYYKGVWETIDHFLLSPEFWQENGWQFQSVSVLNMEPFTNSKGEPASYNARTGFGLSDHLPLLLILNLN